MAAHAMTEVFASRAFTTKAAHITMVVLKTGSTQDYGSAGSRLWLANGVGRAVHEAKLGAKSVHSFCGAVPNF